MIESLKRTLYASLGASVYTAEKLESVLQDFVEKGKLSAEEARAAAQRVTEESKAEFESTRGQVESWFEELLEKSPVVRRKDFDSLAERVSTLESEVAQLKGEPTSTSESESDA
jgi:polyhydroxyalkanoate synthesis regulator phasin